MFLVSISLGKPTIRSSFILLTPNPSHLTPNPWYGILHYRPDSRLGKNGEAIMSDETTPDPQARELDGTGVPHPDRSITRRDFLRRSALTVGGAIAAGSVLTGHKGAMAAPVDQSSPPAPTQSPIGGNMLPPMDLSSNPYSTTRHSIIAPRGVVATSQPLAVKAGLKMLELGGNAVDAAIATAIALTVVEPTSNGLGADAFALVWDGGKLSGLNGSGRAPGRPYP